MERETASRAFVVLRTVEDRVRLISTLYIPRTALNRVTNQLGVLSTTCFDMIIDLPSSVSATAAIASGEDVEVRLPVV